MPERGGDEAIAALGVWRIPVPIPFPQAGGPVNVVAVEEEGGGVALFDSGLGTPEAEAAVVAGLAARGHGFADVRRLFVTHGHVDHYGLAEKIRTASGAHVFVHAADRWKVAGPPQWREREPRTRAFLEGAGAPADAIAIMMRVGEAQEQRFAARLPDDIGSLHEGQRLRFAKCEAEVLHMPGHTPGLVCARLEPLRGGGPIVLVADDHLIEKTSPNPILEIFDDGTRFRALPTYFESLARVEAMDFDWVVPGHGACFPEHRAVIASLRSFYARRQEKLLALIPPEGATPVDLVRAIFPQARPFDLFLMIGEILGNLDVLEDAGRVRCSEDGGRLRYLRS